MDDRELLEAAANAAGGRWRWVTCPKYGEQKAPGFRREDGATGAAYWDGWNPLSDDGDAFRLAVKLRIDVLHRVVGGHRVEALAPGGPATVECYSGNECDAATRRAIVRAAAAMATK